MYRYIIRVVIPILALLGLTSGVATATATATASATPQRDHIMSPGDTMNCDVRLTPDHIEWQPTFEYAEATLVVAGPEPEQLVRTYGAEEKLILDISETARQDGLHLYELRFRPIVTAESAEAMVRLRNSEEQPAFQSSELLPEPLPVLSGNFRIVDGKLLDPAVEEDRGGETAGVPIVGNRDTQTSTAIGPLDQVYSDDLITTGSFCVGFDCQDGESFGSDTIRLKENNLRIHFNDTSALPQYATTDWALVANDQASGGASRFSIEQRDNGRAPITVAADARNHAIYAASDHIGLGTSVPETNLDIVDSWSPRLQLHLDNTGGFATYKWEIEANESNFFIRDVTGGNLWPIRLGPALPNNSLTVRYADGRVGIGTWSPVAKLHIVGDTDTTYAKIENTATTTATRTLAHLSNQGATSVVVENRALESTWTHTYTDTYTMVYSDTQLAQSVQALQLDRAGNLIINGALVESSDVALKENFEPVDSEEALRALAELDIQSWNYRADGDEVRHLGPMAQDFYAAFGLGVDDKHISPLDANGVTMAATQALIDRVEAQEQEITTLQAQNADLERRLAALEAVVDALLMEP